MFELITALSQKLLDRDMMLVTAESCTGGLIAKLMTDIAGSSAVFERAFVTYSNEAKTEMIGVDEKLIAEYGAVSEHVAKAMADGALKNSRAQIALACTGIAGPSGGSKEKPVGLVYIAVALEGQDTAAFEHVFEGDREAVRMQTAELAMRYALAYLEESEEE